MINVLNEPLYKALVAAYEDVVIVNEDSPMIVSRMPVVDVATGGRLSDMRISSDMVDEGGEYYTINCPFCDDKDVKRHRLWVCHAWGSRIDVNGLHIPVSKGLVHCYNEHCMNNHEYWKKFCQSVEGKWKPDVVTHSTCSNGPLEVKPVVFPSTFYVNVPGADPMITNYLTGRGYDLNELAKHWDFRYGKIDFYDVPAVIMPVYFDGKYAFWQARYPVNGEIPEFFHDGRRKPKYYIPAGAKKSLVLYNMDRAIHTDTIVLVEGIFDAVRIGDSGVAMFGKKPSGRQANRLYAMASDKRVVWIPDQDDEEAVEAARTYTERWNMAGAFEGGAHMLTLPDGDPAEYTREEIWRMINA